MTASSSQILGILILTGFLILFIGLVILILWQDRRRASNLQQEASQAGFFPLESPPVPLISAIKSMVAHTHSQNVSCRSIWKRSTVCGDLYLADLSMQTGQDAQREESALVLIDPWLSLPDFSLIAMPGPDTPSSWLRSLTGGIVQAAFSTAGSLPLLNLSGRPDLANRLYITGKDEASVLHLFSAQALDLLDRTEALALCGSGPALMLQRYLQSKPRGNISIGLAFLSDLILHLAKIWEG